MAMDWYHYLKRYVWDENKTPFFTAVGKLNRSQAESELFLYAMFLSVPGALVGAAALADVVQNGNLTSIWPGLYAASVCLAAALVKLRKSQAAAYYSVTVPVVMLGYLFITGFDDRPFSLNHLVLIAMLLLWIRYTLRVAAMTRSYPGMPEKPESE